MKAMQAFRNLKSVRFSKRTLLAASLVGLLIIAAVVNQWMNSSVKTTDDASDKVASAFAAYRAERNLTRQREVEYLDSIINNTKSDAATIKKAQEQKMLLASNMEEEATIETVLKTKGLTDCVVTFRSGAVNVMVNLPEVTQAQVAQVLEIVQRESGEKAENIKIIPASR